MAYADRAGLTPLNPATCRAPLYIVRHVQWEFFISDEINGPRDLPLDAFYTATITRVFIWEITAMSEIPS